MDWLTGLPAVLNSPAPVAYAAALAVVIMALRKRRDVDVEDMQKRLTELTERVELLESEAVEGRAELSKARDTLVTRDRQVFLLRSSLARHGHPDPTALEAS